jgi:hypothetical protein
MFRRRPLPTVTNDAYARWLRAWRPPWVWFLRLPEEEQETLAVIGDEHSQDLAVATALALKQPEAAVAGLTTSPEALEESLARQLAAGLAGKIVQARQTPGYRPEKREPVSMGGVGDRRAERHTERQEAKDSARRLFGRAPDRGAE